jgi:peptidyl-prolyl cis-trans isomerase C
MLRRLRTLAPGRVLSAAILLLAAATPARAEAPGLEADAVVARVGARSITVGELDKRIAGIPPFQLRSLGSTPGEIRRAFLERVMIRDVLLAEGARAESLEARADVTARLHRLLRGALLDQMRADAAKDQPVTDADIKAYYDANRDKFHSPPRIAIWRILLPTREAAVEVLGLAKKDLSVKNWDELARERSLDKATAKRKGALGFVAPDGSTAEIGFEVSPGLFEAAARVKDTELVPEPVREGNGYAVVWRRQSSREVVRTLEQEATGIRQVIVHERADKRVRELLERLRREDLGGYSPELVDSVEVTSAGEIQPMRRPGTLPAGRTRVAQPVPVQGPAGLR